MIYKSRAVSRMVWDADRHGKQVDESCCMCDKVLSGGQAALRRHENNRIICVLCLVEIAEVTVNEPIPRATK